jgi:hypothetical protein
MDKDYPSGVTNLLPIPFRRLQTKESEFHRPIAEKLAYGGVG